MNNRRLCLSDFRFFLSLLISLSPLSLSLPTRPLSFPPRPRDVLFELNPIDFLCPSSILS